MKVSMIVAVVLSSVQYLFCEEGVEYIFKRNNCSKFNSKFVYNTSCYIRPFNRTARSISNEFNFQPNVFLTNISAEIQTYFKFGTVYRPNLIKFTENVCDVLNGKGFQSHFLNAFSAPYAKYSNFLKPCPKSGKMYVKDMIMDTSKFPQFLPVGEYRTDFKAFTYMNGKKEFIVLVQDFIDVKPLGAEQF